MKAGCGTWCLLCVVPALSRCDAGASRRAQAHGGGVRAHQYPDDQHRCRACRAQQLTKAQRRKQAQPTHVALAAVAKQEEEEELAGSLGWSTQAWE